jgi:hypothetical protein
VNEPYVWLNVSAYKTQATDDEMPADMDVLLDQIDAQDGDVIRRTHGGRATVFVVRYGKLVEIHSRKDRNNG